MASRRAPIAARTLAGRYELRDLIGTGGMATVHRAWDTRLGREVAVKRLVPSLALDPVVRHRFEAEANAAARISHPNVVTVFDTNERDGEPFIVMECLSGATLAGELATAGCRSGASAEIAVDVLSGLAAAHDLDVDSSRHQAVEPARRGRRLDQDRGLRDREESRVARSHRDRRRRRKHRRTSHPSDSKDSRQRPGATCIRSASFCTNRQPVENPSPAIRRPPSRTPSSPARANRCAKHARTSTTELATAIERAMARRPEDRFATARDMTAGLRRPELEDTMAISAVDLFGEPTEAVAVTRTAAIPDSGSTSRQIVPVEPGERAPSRRTWGTFVFAAAVVAVILVGALVFLAARSNPTPAANTPTTSTPAPAPHGANPAPLPAQLQDGLQQLENAVRP